MKPIQDARGKIIGYESEDSLQIRIFNESGIPLGFYLKKPQKTFKSNGIFVGAGNQLMRLLKG